MILKSVITLAAFAVALNCEKDKFGKHTSEQLLTSEPWVLYAAGYDDNKNGTIDPLENILDQCQQDNQYRFQKNGYGMITEGLHFCDPATHTPFTWKFANAESDISIGHQLFSISKLRASEMQLSTKIAGYTRDFMLEYKR